MLERWNALGMSAQHLRQNMVGWLIGIEQNQTGISATLASYDHHRLQLGGIPAFSFLLAFPKLPNKSGEHDGSEKETPSSEHDGSHTDHHGAVLLLRLVGSTTLRQDMVKDTLIQHYQSIPTSHDFSTPATPSTSVPGQPQTNNLNTQLDDMLNSGLDVHTHNFLSFGGYVCQVLGSLYQTPTQKTITFGADIEYLPSACIYTVKSLH